MARLRRSPRGLGPTTLRAHGHTAAPRRSPSLFSPTLSHSSRHSRDDFYDPYVAYRPSTSFRDSAEVIYGDYLADRGMQYGQSATQDADYLHYRSRGKDRDLMSKVNSALPHHRTHSPSEAWDYDDDADLRYSTHPHHTRTQSDKPLLEPPPDHLPDFHKMTSKPPSQVLRNKLEDSDSDSTQTKFKSSMRLWLANGLSDNRTNVSQKETPQTYSDPIIYEYTPYGRQSSPLLEYSLLSSPNLSARQSPAPEYSEDTDTVFVPKFKPRRRKHISRSKTHFSLPAGRKKRSKKRKRAYKKRRRPKSLSETETSTEVGVSDGESYDPYSSEYEHISPYNAPYTAPYAPGYLSIGPAVAEFYDLLGGKAMPEEHVAPSHVPNNVQSRNAVPDDDIFGSIVDAIRQRAYANFPQSSSNANEWRVDMPMYYYYPQDKSHSKPSAPYYPPIAYPEAIIPAEPRFMPRIGHRNRVSFGPDFVPLEVPEFYEPSKELVMYEPQNNVQLEMDMVPYSLDLDAVPYSFERDAVPYSFERDAVPYVLEMDGTTPHFMSVEDKINTYTRPIIETGADPFIAYVKGLKTQRDQIRNRLEGIFDKHAKQCVSYSSKTRPSYAQLAIEEGNKEKHESKYTKTTVPYTSEARATCSADWLALKDDITFPSEMPLRMKEVNDAKNLTTLERIQLKAALLNPNIEGERRRRTPKSKYAADKMRSLRMDGKDPSAESSGAYYKSGSHASKPGAHEGDEEREGGGDPAQPPAVSKLRKRIRKAICSGRKDPNYF